MSDGESIAGREREVTFHTPGALTREQVEEVFNAVYWHGDQQGAKQCKVLDGIDALRATIEQQAQELERLKREFVNKDQIIASLAEQLAAAQARCRGMEERKDVAYLERNHLVAALARCFPSGIRKTAIEGWSDDWHGCIYIDLPAGQISYHYHDSQAFLFESLPEYATPYDGHTKEQVHARLQSAQLQATLAAREASILQQAKQADGNYEVYEMAKQQRDAAVQQLNELRGMLKEAAASLTCEVCKMDMERALKGA